MVEKKDQYVLEKKIGEGAFGSVFLAKRKTDKLSVAIKMMRRSRHSGVDWTAVREIKLLTEIKSTFVVDLIDVFTLDDSVNMVMEFCPFDLEKVIKNKSILLSERDIKAYMFMTLSGVAAIHSCWVLHRDIKPANLLINKKRQIKLADFGLACLFGDPDQSSASYKVVTLPYRAPELLFGATEYGGKVDVWSVACVFAELLLRRIFLPGTNESDQLAKIFCIFGTPDEKQWPKLKFLHRFVAFTPKSAMQPHEVFGSVYSAHALDLLYKMFRLNPLNRPTAKEALNHPWFVDKDSEPQTPLEHLPYDIAS